MSTKEDFEQLDIENLTFRNIRESRGGSFIADPNQKYLYINKSISREGISTNNKNCYIDVDIKDDLLTFFSNIDKTCKDNIRQNSEEWFSKKLSDHQIELYYSSIVSYRKKYDRDPYIRFKIPMSKQNLNLKICNEDNQSLSHDDLPEDELILSGIIEIKGLNEII